jgi:hypothetical protein
VMGVFKIESLELRSSISLPPEQLGLQAWAFGAQHVISFLVLGLNSGPHTGDTSQPNIHFLKEGF